MPLLYLTFTCLNSVINVNGVSIVDFEQANNVWAAISVEMAFVMKKNVLATDKITCKKNYKMITVKNK